MGQWESTPPKVGLPAPGGVTERRLLWKSGRSQPAGDPSPLPLYVAQNLLSTRVRGGLSVARMPERAMVAAIGGERHASRIEMGVRWLRQSWRVPGLGERASGLHWPAGVARLRPGEMKDVACAHSVARGPVHDPWCYVLLGQVISQEWSGGCWRGDVCGVVFGGQRGTRTPDILLVRQAL